MCVCVCVCVCAFLLKGWFAVSQSLLLSPSLQVEKREDESSLMQLKEEVKSVCVCVCVWVGGCISTQGLASKCIANLNVCVGMY